MKIDFPAGLDLSTRGMEVVERLGSQELVADVAGTSPDMARLLVDVALGDVLARPGLDVRMRELLAVAMLSSLGADEGHLAVHVDAALGAGASAGELVEVVMQVVTFAGFPRALSAFSVLGSRFRQHGIAGPVLATAREVVMGFVEAIQVGDIDGVLTLLTDDVSWEVPGDPGVIPWAGHRTGHDAVREFYDVLLAETEREEFSVGPVMAHGELVLVPGTFGYRFPATGGRYSGEFVIAFTVRSGKICRYQMHEDSHGLAQGYRANT